MYTPINFQVIDLNKIVNLVQNNGFATVITIKQDVPLVSHLPLMIERKENSLTLLGHTARANEHWRYFVNGQEILTIFH